MVLAGGRSRRMGGGLKPLLRVGGVTMLDRVLAALAGSSHTVVVGPSELDDHLAGVPRVQEQPPGGGPVAAIGAGFAAVSAAARVAVLAADLPFLTAQALEQLTGAGDCAVYVDGQGRRQPLVAVWATESLRRALEAVPRKDASMKELLGAVNVTELTWAGQGPPPWFDCDTPEALEEAQKWLR
ncbi:molybdenum cofactor guanylyltransferase [Rhizocola hellebori]|uniref:molybdenum cofactor guanylyltransferase n=1 Tax=Rhizocola hellebori TaxID=1392758 RepID=UPI0019445870|nr:NTP transferase domain-containing protein [Rhizocola hellebori]